MPRFFWIFTLASFFSTGSFVSGIRAQEPDGGQYVVVAVAADIQSAVLRDSLGNVRRYGNGDTLTEAEWRVISIRAEYVNLRSEMRLQGRQVELQLREGDRFDPSTMSATIRREGEPVYSVERMVPEDSSARRSKKD